MRVRDDALYKWPRLLYFYFTYYFCLISNLVFLPFATLHTSDNVQVKGWCTAVTLDDTSPSSGSTPTPLPILSITTDRGSQWTALDEQRLTPLHVATLQWPRLSH